MKKLTVFFFFALGAVSMFAQTLPNKCDVYKPTVLITRMLRQSDVDHLLSSPDYCQAESKSGKKTFWIVYSDRNNNEAYTASTGTTVATTLPTHAYSLSLLCAISHLLVKLLPQ